MQFLRESECAAWCRDHGYPASVKELPFQSIEYATDSGRKMALAREVMTGSGPSLIWFREWGVWPSSEHMPLFARFREALGHTLPLIETPGHLIDATELDDGISLLAMGLLFFWDCSVFPARTGRVFHASHDEIAGYFGPAAEK